MVVAVLAAAGFAAALLYQERLPPAVLDYARRWDGLPLLVALSLGCALLVGLGMRLARPRSLLAPWVALLLGGAAVAGGMLSAAAVQAGHRKLGTGPDTFMLVYDAFREGLPLVSSNFGTVLAGSRELVAAIAGAGVLALLLVALKVRRVRRADRTVAAEIAPSEPEEEVEYRGAFEPVQPAQPAAPAPLVPPLESLPLAPQPVEPLAPAAQSATAVSGDDLFTPRARD
ncbi:hypothetical protein [Nonomuraea sp. NPDC050310]|uniref:hypothetical protein n=1 Tax=Nonomuraea sp. NPDC050310 TaxID=3154935 RepID=UPI0033E0CED2